MTSALEQQFCTLWKIARGNAEPRPVPQFKIEEWRGAYDFAFPDHKILIELQGGIWQQKRTGHSTGRGILRDCRKANAATLAGWRVLKYCTTDLEKRPAQVIEEIVSLIQGR